MVAETLRRHDSHDADALPVLGATELLAGHAARIAAMRKAVGIPDAHWQALYLSVLEAFAEFVQQLPASEAHHHCGIGGLLEHAIDVTCKAIVLRQGHQLPAGASAEEIAKKRDLWTYAAAMGALLHDIGKPLTDQHIHLFNAGGKSLGPWNPWMGRMPDAAVSYRVTFLRERRYRLHERVPLLMARLFVPPEGLRWLGSDLDVLQTFLSVLGNDPDGAGVLGELVRQADGHSVAEDLSGGVTTRLSAATDAVDREVHIPATLSQTTAATAPHADEESAATPPSETDDSSDTEPCDDTPVHEGVPDLGDQFFTWLKDGIRSGRLVLNARNARVHVTSDGLLLVSPAIFKDFDSARWAEAQKRFQKRKLHKKTETSTNIWTFTVTGEHRRGVIKGLLIPDPQRALALHLPEPNPHLSLLASTPERGSCDSGTDAG